MKLLAKIGLLGILGGAGATAIHADPAGGWLSPNGQGAPSSAPAQTPQGAPTPPGGLDPNGASGASASMGASVALSLPEIQTRVHQLHEQTRADARHIQHLQQIARNEKDVIKLNCVNDKLVQVKPQMNIADNGEAELEAANDSNRMVALDTISQAAENIRRLREEADQCIGEPVNVASDSSNSFTAPPMADDPTKGFTDTQMEPPGYIEPPSYASPYN